CSGSRAGCNLFQKRATPVRLHCQSILRLLAVLTNRRNQNAPPVERINSTTAFAPLNNGNAVVIMSRKNAAASVAKC
ncbi:MAG TPA: hypothetical protein VNY07_02260, partial [Chthoniobacterales bacterium]|nr:hypothetical protein [Chthoniobacterales bacterium]